MRKNAISNGSALTFLFLRSESTIVIRFCYCSTWCAWNEKSLSNFTSRWTQDINWQLCDASLSDKNEICKQEIWSQKLLTRHEENCKEWDASHSIWTSLKSCGIHYRLLVLWTVPVRLLSNEVRRKPVLNVVDLILEAKKECGVFLFQQTASIGGRCQITDQQPFLNTG